MGGVQKTGIMGKGGNVSRTALSSVAQPSSDQRVAALTHSLTQLTPVAAPLDCCCFSTSPLTGIATRPMRITRSTSSSITCRSASSASSSQPAACLAPLISSHLLHLHSLDRSHCSLISCCCLCCCRCQHPDLYESSTHGVGLVKGARNKIGVRANRQRQRWSGGFQSVASTFNSRVLLLTTRVAMSCSSSLLLSLPSSGLPAGHHAGRLGIAKGRPTQPASSIRIGKSQRQIISS